MPTAHPRFARNPGLSKSSRISCSNECGPERAATQGAPSRSIYLVIRVCESAAYFELPAGKHEVVTVGACQQVDVRYADPEVASLSFYFERCEDEVWLVPAYSSSSLRANATRISNPMRLGPRTVIEFGSHRLTAELESRRPGNLRCGFRSESPPDTPDSVDYVNGLPKSDELTQLPWSANGHSQPSIDSSNTVCVQPSESSPRPSVSPALCPRIEPLGYTLLGLAPSANGAPAQRLKLHWHLVGQLEPEPTPSTCNRVALPSEALQTNLASASRTDWLCAIGRGAKYHPARTHLLALLLALAGSLLVMCIVKVYLEH